MVSGTFLSFRALGGASEVQATPTYDQRQVQVYCGSPKKWVQPASLQSRRLRDHKGPGTWTSTHLCLWQEPLACLRVC